MVGSAGRARDADSSRAPGLTSDLQGSVNVHRGALLLVEEDYLQIFKCMSFWLHGYCGKWEGWALVNRFNHNFLYMKIILLYRERIFWYDKLPLIFDFRKKSQTKSKMKIFVSAAKHSGT